MNTQALGIIAALGLLLPNLQSIIQRPWWSSRTKTYLTIGVATLGGLVGYVATNGLTFGTPSNAVLWIVGVYLASVTFYHGLLKPSGIAAGIEVGTTPTPNPETDIEGDMLEDEVEPDDVDEEPTDGGEMLPPEDFDDGSGPVITNTTDEPHDEAQQRLS